MKKRLVVLLATIIILTAAAQAADSNFSIQKSYDWLLKQQSNGSYGGIIETSVAILALKAADYSPTNSIEYLNSQENAQHCWPKASCRTKDTAFAVLAYNIMGVATEDITNWMKNAQSAALQSGNWWLEVTTTDTGTCTVKYTKNNQEVTKTIRVQNGRFPDCGNTTFFNINNCLEANFVKNYPTIKLYVDCGTLNNALISLIYNSANLYYILTESQSGVAEIAIENGCFGIGYKDPACNYESSLYANWALNVAGAGSSSKIYLRDNYDKTNTLHNALLFLIFEENKYLEELKARQRSDGSWDNDVYRTALAVLAMKGQADYTTEFNKAVEWLKTKQRTDGSFGDVTTTAMVLYAAFTQGGVEFPSCTNEKKDVGERGVDCGGVCEEYDDCCHNDVKDEGEEGVDCGGVCIECGAIVCDEDGKCESENGEDCNNCPEDCPVCEEECDNDGICESTEDCDCSDCKYEDRCTREVCYKNGVCDYDLVYRGYEQNENIENCPEDCKIGDGICDEKETHENSPDDCPEEVCDHDGICDEGETEEGCPSDCAVTCNEDGTCDEGESCSCADCKNEEMCKVVGKGKFPWWIVVILLFLLLAVVIYMIYMKKKKGKEKPGLFGFGKPLLKKPEIKEFKPIGPIRETKSEKGVTISMPTRPKATPSKVESELEKSIKEAKKLLGKK
ncbi:MAG: prenyltransferase/squalene oxidase repeat-containing protein [Candidatus Nanoarchaeia archaeon]